MSIKKDVERTSRLLRKARKLLEDKPEGEIVTDQPTLEAGEKAMKSFSETHTKMDAEFERLRDSIESGLKN